MSLLQQSYTPSNPYTYSCYTSFGLLSDAVLFTADSSYTLDTVELRLSRSARCTVDCTVEIYATTGGLPTGSALASCVLDYTNINVYPSVDWVTFTLSNTVSLTNGVTYAIARTPTEDTYAYEQYWYGDDAEPGVYVKYDNDTYYPGEAGWKDFSVTGVGGEMSFRTYSEESLTKPTNPTPANNATGVDFSGFELSWDAGGGATSYSVYIGTTGNLTSVSPYQEAVSYTTSLAALEAIYEASPINQKIYWRVDSHDDLLNTATGDEWNFDARPTKVTTPSPANSATGIRLFPTYGWTASDYATTYNLHVEIP